MKAKIHKGTQKRVKVTATGKFITAKMGKRHLLQNKSSKAKGRGKYGAPVDPVNNTKMKWAFKSAGSSTKSKKAALESLTPGDNRGGKQSVK